MSGGGGMMATTGGIVLKTLEVYYLHRHHKCSYVKPVEEFTLEISVGNEELPHAEKGEFLQGKAICMALEKPDAEPGKGSYAYLY